MNTSSLKRLSMRYAGLLPALMLVVWFGVGATRAQTTIEDPLNSNLNEILENIDPDARSHYFLEIDGIEGESQDELHLNEIDILSFSWGESNSADRRTGGGAGAGKVSMQDVHFAMLYNKASVKLFLACASGEHFPKAVLSLRKSGNEPVEYLKWTFSDAMCSSYQTGGANPEIPMDQFSLNFAKIEVEYKPQEVDGSLGAPLEAGWDLKLNKKV